MQETIRREAVARPGEVELERAYAHLQARQVRSAITEFDRAEAAGADANRCAAGRWDCWMLQGEFARAWAESDAIARRNGGASASFWDGSPVDGRRVIVRTLHGYGDAIQMIRFAPLLRARADFLIVETHPALVDLLSGVDGVDMVTTWGRSHPARQPEWDIQIEVMELPYVFRTTVETLPCSMPYLRLPGTAIARSRALIGESGRPRVGLVWASSVNWNAERSMRLADMLPLLHLPEFSFYSLQWGSARAELLALPDGLRLPDTAAHSPTILDTAADIAAMDLVITVDTMAAHLAGALGKPVWTLLAEPADWRWMVERADTPWYPTMRLFRQERPGDWEGVIAAVMREMDAQKTPFRMLEPRF